MPNILIRKTCFVALSLILIFGKSSLAQNAGACCMRCGCELVDNEIVCLRSGGDWQGLGTTCRDLDIFCRPAACDPLRVPLDHPTIQAAIDAAVDGDEIVVAPGPYPERINFLGKAITLRSSGGPDITAIYGTDLGGGLVTCSSGEGPDTVLEGFTVRRVDQTSCTSNARCNALMVNVSSSPTVRNCRFLDNRAENGGGMSNAFSSPTVTGCTFSGNAAIFNGGGMYNFSSSPTLTDCIFRDNTAGDNGGGMSNTFSSPTLTNCRFSGNTATNGGGIYSSGNGFDPSGPTVTETVFSQNTAFLSGGGMYSFQSRLTVSNCMFSGNLAGPFDNAGVGGGMANEKSSSILSDTSFETNTANAGGAIYNFHSNVTITNCAFRENAAVSEYFSVRIGEDLVQRSGGGAVFHFGGNATVTKCTFLGNTSEADGGGMNIRPGAAAVVTSCLFQGNTAGVAAGGLFSVGSPLTVTNTVFSGNEAPGAGGIFVGGGPETVTNCTFSGNSSTALPSQGGGGGAMLAGQSTTITNCILWGDSPDEIFIQGSGPTVTFSDIQGGFTGTGNIKLNPRFVNARGLDNIFGTEDDDLRLRSSSPCIDAGDNAAVPPDAADLDNDGDTAEPLPFDLNGNDRFHRGVVDMGAYEGGGLLSGSGGGLTAGDDADSDGVPNGDDRCQGTVLGSIVDSNGCSCEQLDDDGDDVNNCDDACPDDPSKVDPGVCGCDVADDDSDGDGVMDCDDLCPDTTGEAVDKDGCPVEPPSEQPLLDTDGDGIVDVDDRCANTPRAVAVDADGCPADDGADLPTETLRSLCGAFGMVTWSLLVLGLVALRRHPAVVPRAGRTTASLARRRTS